MKADAASPGGQRRAAWLAPLALGCGATLAVVLLYAPWIATPHIRYDDFDFLTRSRTWSETWANLFRPMNEHVMPMSRLAAGILMQVTPEQSAIPRAAEIQGVLAVVVGMWLLYVFALRELRHPFYAVTAMALFGVTSTYYECVTWYSASFFTLALDTMLLGLLAAQSYRQTGRWHALAACGACCAVAPAFHSTALLAGAWCALYLLFVDRDEPLDRQPPIQRIVKGISPVIGTIAFLAVGLAAAAGRPLQAKHYRGKGLLGAFDPIEGIQNTLRTLVDNQVLGAFGLWDRASVLSWTSVLAAVGVLIVLGGVWWRLTRQRRLLVLGLALIFGSDLIVYSARADWSYERSVHNWTRYHLFPHLGLVLFVVGGLPRFEGRWFTLSAGRLSRSQFVALAVLIAVLFAGHRPRAHQSQFAVPPQQLAILQRVERVDARCRAAGIDGHTARRALGFLKFPLGYERDNAWEFLRGSSSPRPMSVDDARALLEPIR